MSPCSVSFPICPNHHAGINNRNEIGFSPNAARRKCYAVLAKAVFSFGFDSPA